MNLRPPRRFRISGCATTSPLPRSGAMGKRSGKSGASGFKQLNEEKKEELREGTQIPPSRYPTSPLASARFHEGSRAGKQNEADTIHRINNYPAPCQQLKANGGGYVCAKHPGWEPGQPGNNLPSSLGGSFNY